MGPHANEILRYVCRKPLPFVMIPLPLTLPYLQQGADNGQSNLVFYTSTTHLKYVII